MRILLTGASGFVGGHLAPALAADGHDVFALVREPERYSAPEGVSIVKADLARPLDLGALPAVDAVLHFAQGNVPFPDEATALYAVNTGSTQQLLEHARRGGAERFVYASSASVYGLGARPFAEGDQPAPSDFYAVTKLNAEQLLDAYRGHFATAALRLVAPYGPGQTARMIPGVIGRVREGRPVTLNDGGRPRMNPIYVDDVVRAATGVLSLDGAHVLNVAGDETASIRELALLAGDALGREPVFEEGGTAAGDIVADTTRLHELLELRPLVGLAEGIRRTVGASEPGEAPG